MRGRVVCGGAVALIALLSSCVDREHDLGSHPNRDAERCVEIAQPVTGKIESFEYMNFEPDLCPGVYLGVDSFADADLKDRFTSGLTKNSVTGDQEGCFSLSFDVVHRTPKTMIKITSARAVPCT